MAHKENIEKWLAAGLNFLNPHNPDLILKVRLWRAARAKADRADRKLKTEELFEFEKEVLQAIADGRLKAEQPPFLLTLWKVRQHYNVFCTENSWRSDVAMPDIKRVDFEQWCAKKILEKLDG